MYCLITRLMYLSPILYPLYEEEEQPKGSRCLVAFCDSKACALIVMEQVLFIEHDISNCCCDMHGKLSS